MNSLLDKNSSPPESNADAPQVSIIMPAYNTYPLHPDSNRQRTGSNTQGLRAKALPRRGYVSQDMKLGVK